MVGLSNLAFKNKVWENNIPSVGNGNWHMKSARNPIMHVTVVRLEKQSNFAKSKFVETCGIL